MSELAFHILDLTLKGVHIYCKLLLLYYYSSLESNTNEQSPIISNMFSYLFSYLFSKTFENKSATTSEQTNVVILKKPLGPS